MFHVKRFGLIDGLRKRTFARGGAVRSWDLGQAKECLRFIWGILSRVDSEVQRSADSAWLVFGLPWRMTSSIIV
jgi:hypothetical protein